MAKKKEKKKNQAYKIYKIYKVEGDKIIEKNRFCPKCGPGVFLARHKDKWHCGKCGYTEFIN